MRRLGLINGTLLLAGLLLIGVWGLMPPATLAEPTAQGSIPPGAVVINEVAWSGTAASSADEWLELVNTTAQTISLSGWVLTSTGGLSLPLTGVITPGGTYLMERTDDDTVSDIAADLIYSGGLNNDGEGLFLSNNGLLIDTANGDGGPWPGGAAGPDYPTLERLDPLLPDADGNWGSNDTLTRNGLDAEGNPLNGTPKQPNSTTVPPPPPPPVLPLLISEFLYDGVTPSSEGDEFVEICNPNQEPVDVAGYKVGDEESAEGGESMYLLPQKMLTPTGCLVIAKNATDFQARFGLLPDFEVKPGAADQPTVPNLEKHTAWGSGGWALANNGDELLLLGPDDSLLDSVAYRNGAYETLGLEPPATAPDPRSLQRAWPVDTNSMPHDFLSTDPTPGLVTAPPPPPDTPPAPAVLADGMNAYWGHLHAHTTYSDGAGPPYYALAQARSAGLHFYAITDHGWWLTNEEWQRTLTQTNEATVPGQFIALRGIEWTHATAGHINVFNDDTLLSREDSLFADLSEFYTWLLTRPEAIAQFNHPDPTYGGTFYDFAFHPAAAQVVYLQEIGNGAQDYVTYEPSFVRSNMIGWRTAPTINGDTHTARWGFDIPARTGIVAPALTEADLLDGLRARRVFATEDSNLAVSLRAEEVWMGSLLPQAGPVNLTIDVIDPDPEPFTLLLYDINLPLVQVSFDSGAGQWSGPVDLLPGHYLWAKVIQADGDLAYSAPLWAAGQLTPQTVYINELLPAPGDVDWDGNGTADGDDEWLELYNPNDRPVGLGGWSLTDESNIVYHLPLSLTIPARGFLTLYQAQTGFALNNGGDTVTLSHPTGVAVDSVRYDHSPGYDQTWCRLPDGGSDWSDDCGPSPSQPNWERQVNRPLRVSIFEAKRLTDDAWVKIKGRVTAPPGILGARTMYIQDESAGIMIYLPKDHRLAVQLGDKVEVVGNLHSFYHEAEIAVDEPGDVDLLEPGSPPPPLPIVTTSLLEPYEGLLVMLTGQAVRFRGSVRFWVDDGSDPAQVYVRRSTGIRRPYIPLGTPLTVVGIVSQRSEGTPSRDDYRLLLRYPEDLVLPILETPTPTPAASLAADWPTLLPETGR